MTLPKLPKLTRSMKVCNLAWSNSGHHARTPFGAASVVMLDGFDTPASTVAKYASEGAVAIAYLSVGSCENWRPDKGEWPACACGENMDGWPGEKWIDLDAWERVKPLMAARLKMVKKKGFHGVEMDNASVDSREGSKKRALNLAYIRWVAAEAHALGLLVVMKNGPELAKDTVSFCDALITEQAIEFAGDAHMYAVYKQAGKPVWDFEYKNPPQHSTADTSVFSDVNFDGAHGWVRK